MSLHWSPSLSAALQVEIGFNPKGPFLWRTGWKRASSFLSRAPMKHWKTATGSVEPIWTLSALISSDTSFGPIETNLQAYLQRHYVMPAVKCPMATWHKTDNCNHCYADGNTKPEKKRLLSSALVLFLVQCSNMLHVGTSPMQVKLNSECKFGEK